VSHVCCGSWWGPRDRVLPYLTPFEIQLGSVLLCSPHTPIRSSKLRLQENTQMRRPIHTTHGKAERPKNVGFLTVPHAPPSRRLSEKGGRELQVPYRSTRCIALTCPSSACHPISVRAVPAPGLIHTYLVPIQAPLTDSAGLDSTHTAAN
jgi:hypothetical protein